MGGGRKSMPQYIKGISMVKNNVAVPEQRMGEVDVKTRPPLLHFFRISGI